MPLPTIAYLDGQGPLELASSRKADALTLVGAARSTFGPLSYAASAALLPALDRISWNWLEQANNPYRGEIATIAREVGVPGAVALNVCFEWGCTGGVWNSDGTAMLRRVLDWPFPKLGELMVVARQSGPAGDFHNVTWPGFAGVLQAMAVGRFAAAINQAPMRTHGLGYAGDWLRARIATGRSRALPPVHLLRQVFEAAPDFATAKNILCGTPIAVPAIFILSGVRPDEGCVIERTETAYSVREIVQGRVCAANHFEAPPDGKQGWRDRPIDSRGRYARARDLDGGGELSWFVSPIANVNSRLVMTADAAIGRMALMGTMGLAPVTEVFRLPINP